MPHLLTTMSLRSLLQAFELLDKTRVGRHLCDQVEVVEEQRWVREHLGQPEPRGEDRVKRRRLGEQLVCWVRYHSCVLGVAGQRVVVVVVRMMSDVQDVRRACGHRDRKGGGRAGGT